MHVILRGGYRGGDGGHSQTSSMESGSNMLPMLALDLLRCSRGRAEGREVLTLTPAKKLLFFSLLPNF